jgi:hypothetical protein
MNVDGTGRVERNSSREALARIRRNTETSLVYHAMHPEEIDERLAELDQEWDIERALETNASSISLTGLALGLLGWRRMILVPLAVQAFLLQHAVQGWCPPLPLLRRLGYRTRREIERERYALKALRGDFDALAEVEEKDEPSRTARAVLDAVR